MHLFIIVHSIHCDFHVAVKQKETYHARHGNTLLCCYRRNYESILAVAPKRALIQLVAFRQNHHGVQERNAMACNLFSFDSNY
jgi:hypothetical protein